MKRIVLFLTLLFLAAPAAAHFVLGGEVRIVHVDRDAGELLLRIPAPLAYAKALSARSDPTARVEAPFVEAVDMGARWAHRLDTARIAAGRTAFMDFVARGYRLEAPDGPVALTPLSVSVAARADLPSFASPEDARDAASRPDVPAPWVGEAVIHLRLKAVSLPDELTLASTLPEMVLPPQTFIDNHIFDWQGGGVQRRQVAGQLIEPVSLRRAPLAVMAEMTWQGILHILLGPDHVLFVICITLGAASLVRLLWTVTGFTLGHSVTLITGFLGFVPSAPWFVPAVEAGIAMSILLAALLALRGKGRGPGPWLTFGLGLLHGLGFSFVLAEILGPDAPDLVASLLFFNVGVELGQVAIVGAMFAVLAALARLGDRPAALARTGIAACSIGIAVVWTAERLAMVGQVI